MVVQSEIAVIIVWLSILVFEVFSVGTPPRPGSPGEAWVTVPRKVINDKIWRAPSFKPDGPLCDPASVAAKFPSRNFNCNKECIAISARAKIIYDHYKDERASAKTASRQCYGFSDGECINYLNDRVSWCWCKAGNYWQLASACRKYQGWSRGFVNAKIMAANVWDVNVKPALPDVALPAMPKVPVPSLSMPNFISSRWKSGPKTEKSRSRKTETSLSKT